MNENELKLKVLKAIKEAMTNDEGEKAMKNRPKKGIVVEKEVMIGLPKDEEVSPEDSLEDEVKTPDMMSEEECDEDDDIGGGDLMEKIRAMREAKKNKVI